MWILFGQHLEKIGQLFTLTSGHTDRQPHFSGTVTFIINYLSRCLPKPNVSTNDLPSLDWNLRKRWIWRILDLADVLFIGPSVTRNGEISPLWHNLKVFGQFCEGLLSIWVKFWTFFGKKSCYWTNWQCDKCLVNWRTI